MTNEELNTFAGLGEPGQVISAEKVIESAVREENINGDGGVTLEWNSLGSSGLGVGSKVGNKYVLMEPYLPSANGNGAYRYAPKFADPIALLGKALFYKDVAMKELRYDATNGSQVYNEESSPLYTFNYVGLANTLITALANAASVAMGRTITCVRHFAGNPLISVSFDGDTIKSAATKIGGACDEAVWYTEDTIHFGSPVPTMSGEYYNRFVVLGGTKNMTKKIVNLQGVEEYAAVTKRLTLDPVTYPGSIIGELAEGEPAMSKLLIFDNIYPKVQLRIAAVHERRCYLLDENGEKISVGQDYAMYSKWYVQLENFDGGSINQRTLDSQIIDGETLKIQFLPYAEGGTSPLAGRDFEVVHFTGDAQSLPLVEVEDDDVTELDGTKGHTITTEQLASCSWYRIVMNADGSTILPSTTANGIIPKVGDIVSFVNVAVPAEAYTKARAELLARAQQTARQYTNTSPTSFTIEDTGEYANKALGDTIEKDGTEYLITSIRTDLITGERTITFGTLSQKGLISSMVDKVEGAQTSGKGTAAQEGSGVNATSAEQWQALANAGGHRGLVTLNNRLTDVSNALDEVAAQADASMDIWYGVGTPTLSNAPASDWTTDELKAAHVEDIYFDINREAASTGGRAWKWTKSGSTYAWAEVTDMDTLASLEKLADVAGDGVITGGMEKQQLYLDWQGILKDYDDLYDYCTAQGLTGATEYTTFVSAYKDYLCMLNGCTDTNLASLMSGQAIPTWFGTGNSPAFDTTTRLADYTWNISDTSLSCYALYNGSTMTPEMYRAIVNNYQRALIGLRTSLNSDLALKKKTIFVSQPTTPYHQGDMWYDMTTGELRICITTRTSGSFTEGDWSLVTGEKLFYSISDLLADLINVWADPTKGNLSTSLTHAKVYLSDSQPAGYDYFWYDTANEVVYYNDRVQTSLTTYGKDTLNTLSQLGISEFDMYMTATMPTTGLADHDVYFRRSEFLDNFTHEVIQGGLNIWVYDAGLERWRQVQDGTSGLMENYGNHIVNAVFGVSPDGSTNYASGLNIQKTFAQLFATGSNDPQDSDGATALAAIAALVATDANGLPIGYIDLKAKTIRMTPTSGYGGDQNQYDYIYIGDIETGTETQGSDTYDVDKHIGMSVVDEEYHTYKPVEVEYVRRTCQSQTSYMTEEGVGLGGCNDVKAGQITLIGEGYDTTGTVPSDGQLRSYVAETKVTPFGVTSRGFIIKRYVPQDSGQDRTFSVQSYPGADGTFTTADGKTVTVMGGIITSIS